MRLLLFSILVSLLVCSNAHSQDSSLLSMVSDSIATTGRQLATGTFKGTHIINMQSVEQPAKKELSFIMMHRFGKLNDGAYNLFGLDQAEIRLAFDYGVSNRLTIGIGRSSLDKAFDASVKYKVIQQAGAGQHMPFSVSYFSSIVYPTLKYEDKPYLTPKLRTIYTNQVLIARKFNSNLSLQVNPTWLHYNLVATKADKNDLFALAMGGRMKFNKRMSINAEYNLMSSSQMPSSPVKNSMSLGWDIDTGGHVFQLVFSNSAGMVEPYFISKTLGTWGKGDIYFGFNISRIFSFKR